MFFFFASIAHKSSYTAIKMALEVVEHTTVLFFTGPFGRTTNHNPLVLASIFLGIFLVVYEVPETMSIMFYHFFIGTYHRSVKWSMRLCTIGPLREMAISDQPILEFFVRSTVSVRILGRIDQYTMTHVDCDPSCLHLQSRRYEHC